MSKSVCFDRSSRLTATTLLKSPRCRIFNPTHLKRLARVVRGCAPRNQRISQKCLSRITCLRASASRLTTAAAGKSWDAIVRLSVVTLPCTLWFFDKGKSSLAPVSGKALALKQVIPDRHFCEIF